MLKQGIYRHYKGNLYRLVCVARHSETLEEMAIYQDVNAPEKVWARPANMWEESVRVGECDRPRFEYLAEDMDGITLQK